MKLVWWMIVGSVFSATVLAALLGSKIGIGIWLGMLGPLVAAIASWIAMERQYKRRREGLTNLMIKAFAVKMIFFALYIVVLLGFRLVQPVPFAIGFLCYFLSLHIVEAIGLHRLQAAASEMERGRLRNG
jgi:hypothetical protein